MRYVFVSAALMCSLTAANAQSSNEMNVAALDCTFEVKGISSIKYSVKMENGRAVLSFPENSGMSEKKEKEFSACVDKKLGGN
ncbi:MAG: hypothetical protein AAFW87_14445 [Pseudomonadota bacterium]